MAFEEEFERGIRSDNPWWTTGKITDIPEFKRSDYYRYVEDLQQHKVYLLLGPRRCGKTTLIMQVIQHLLNEKNVDPKRILFVSLDRPYYALHAQKLQDAISYYEEKILGKSLQDSREMSYIFADEAHHDLLWARVMKQCVDQR